MGNDKDIALSFLGTTRIPDMIVQLLASADAAVQDLQLRARNISCDQLLVREAMVRAIQTVNYHENTDNPTHRKEVAHFCHWVMRLKPIKIRTPGQSRVIQKTKLKWSDITNLVEEPGEPTDYTLRDTALMINEHAAVRLARFNITRLEKRLIRGRQNEGTLGKLVAASRLRWLIERDRQLALYTNSLVGSFREHTYSARSTAMIFELAYSTQLEDESHVGV